MATNSSSEKYDLLVVGGGFAGRTAARVASHGGASVILVDAKEYFEFTPAACRCIVHPPAVLRSTSQQSHPPGPNVSVLHGVVRDISANKAVVISANEIEREIYFRFCVWAGGSAYESPIRPLLASHSVARRLAELDSHLNTLRRAKRILVIGGGLVGVELAAELTERVPQPSRVASVSGSRQHLDITLATSRSALLPRLPSRAGTLAKHFLRKRGVNIVVGRFHPVAKPSALASQGAVVYQNENDPNICIEADIAFDCTGAGRSPLGDPLRKFVTTIDSENEVIGRAGLVRVRNSLQLRKADNVFVAGDAGIIDNELDLKRNGGLGCEKTAYAASEAGKLAAKNALTLLNGGITGKTSTSRLLRYPEDAFPSRAFPRAFIVSLGKWDGAICLGPVVIGGILAAISKVAIEKLSVRAFTFDGTANKLLGLAEDISFRVSTFFDSRSRRLDRRGAPVPVLA